nr:uncharacterized protein LOC109975301 [Labrus bergylta]
MFDLIVFPDVLCVSVVKGEDTWRVTHSSAQICAVKGSTVEIPCTYTYPSTIRQQTTVVQSRFWFTKDRYEPVDVRTDPDYSGRVEYLFHENVCTLRIKNLAVSGLVIFLLSVSVVQGQDSWRVTYSSLQICAYKGSTVEMNCTFTYPERINRQVNSLQKTFWLRKDGFYYKDVETVSEYSGRVKNICDENKCTLRITNLRETDSTVYRFGFITNKDSYHGRPGVTLSVTDLQVKVSRPHEALLFQCLSGLSSQTSYIWFRNGQKLKHSTSSYYSPEQLLQTDSYSCALSGHEEGSSVTLNCSSDANPAANYTWYKNGPLNLNPSNAGAQLVLSSVNSSASGEYYCEAENTLGRRTSKHISINVKCE